ncbi:ferritin-like domain-containing protein [Phenylobacterium sp.]|uniref:ferritin-like domain-containing protein n=1 Tax=Phenylobacterium sp. TaxID=1871053 RepID=UPI0025CE9772|nr:ferritin-like domain-containing protein [Phenylobacterium sp.]
MLSALSAVHWLIWRDPRRRAENLLRFAEVEADGGRDLVRAAEVTRDPVLRKLFLKHALDEQRHADLFRSRGLALIRTLPRDTASGIAANWLTPGERGLDDLRVEEEGDAALLAFLHLSEASAAREFANYIAVLGADPPTRTVFENVLHDETFHMTYTRAQLDRVAPKGARRRIWMARLRRFWKAYLRLASGLAGLIGAIVLTLQYFIVLPLFAFHARRAAEKEAAGWSAVAPERNGRLDRQY